MFKTLTLTGVKNGIIAETEDGEEFVFTLHGLNYDLRDFIVEYFTKPKQSEVKESE